MKKQREILIEIERERTIYLRTCYHARCAECNTNVDFLTAAEAAALARITIEIVFQRAELGYLHTQIMSDGKLLVCLNSLLEAKSF